MKNWNAYQWAEFLWDKDPNTKSSLAAMLGCVIDDNNVIAELRSYRDKTEAALVVYCRSEIDDGCQRCERNNLLREVGLYREPVEEAK